MVKEERKQLFRLDDLFDDQLLGNSEGSFLVYAVAYNYGSMINSFISQEQAEEHIKELKEARYGSRIELYHLMLKRISKNK